MPSITAEEQKQYSTVVRGLHINWLFPRASKGKKASSVLEKNHIGGKEGFVDARLDRVSEEKGSRSEQLR